MVTTLLEQIVAGEALGLMPVSVDDYHRMIETEVIREGSPIELIDGTLLLKDRRDSKEGNPKTHGPRHATVVKMLAQLIDRLVEPHGCHSQSQLPVTLPPRHEPEPDVAVVRGEMAEYIDRLPGAEDIVAVMEVASSSLLFDRRTKQAVYAQAGIPCYWILNVAASEIEVYSNPNTNEGRYESLATHDRSSDAIGLNLPSVNIDVAPSSVFPQARE